MNKKAKIQYFALTDEMLKREKLDWFIDNKLKDIPFETIHPDKNNNWINLTDNDFEELLPLQEKNNKQTVFVFSSLGVSTNRDAWVYDFDEKNLINKVQFFIKTYNELLENKDYSWNTEIKWSRDLKKKFNQNKDIVFQINKIIQANYRPFTKINFYSEKLLNDILTQNHFDIFGENLDKENIGICFSGKSSSKGFQIIAVNSIWGLDFLEKTNLVPLFRYDKSGNRIENITDWGLEKFTEHYKTDKITKKDIFHYTYGVLHNPAYRKKYELNLKREFPRLPFYKNFEKWVNWGKKLMGLHINYETVDNYELKITNYELKNKKEDYIPKAKLKRDKETGEITLDEQTSILGIPEIAFDYKLGNRSAIDWILDQYKEKKPRDKTIAEKFNTYKFADYKDTVIDLIERVTTVSVKTMEIVNQMEAEEPHKD